MSASVKASLYDGQVVTLHDKTGNWWYIQYGDGLYGYASASYISSLGLKSASVRTRGSNLNVRSGAGLNYSIKDKLKNGETVLCLGTYGNFTKVLYNGNSVGYVASEYLSISNGASAASIALNLPSYKQYDSRWARLTLPGSGESIRTHGCAVTALAMTESYRLGTTVTPANILESEKFTSGGAIYWPKRVWTRRSYRYVVFVFLPSCGQAGHCPCEKRKTVLRILSLYMDIRAENLTQKISKFMIRVRRPVRRWLTFMRSIPILSKPSFIEFRRAKRRYTLNIRVYLRFAWMQRR